MKVAMISFRTISDFLINKTQELPELWKVVRLNSFSGD